MTADPFAHSILRYIIDQGLAQPGGEPVKLPPLDDLAQSLRVSRGKLREDMLTAQAYGLIEMRPGDGTYVCPFDFYAAIRPAVLYGIACDGHNFDRIYRLRAQLEVAFWDQAVESLTESDLRELQSIVERAECKLAGRPIEIPHREHRELHLRIFERLDNPFVQGLLKAYWDAYEAVELHRYFELNYYQQMWDSHRQMVEAITSGQSQQGRDILRSHFRILEDRLQSQNF